MPTLTEEQLRLCRSIDSYWEAERKRKREAEEEAEEKKKEMYKYWSNPRNHTRRPCPGAEGDGNEDN